MAQRFHEKQNKTEESRLDITSLMVFSWNGMMDFRILGQDFLRF